MKIMYHRCPFCGEETAMATVNGIYTTLSCDACGMSITFDEFPDSLSHIIQPNKLLTDKEIVYLYSKRKKN